MAFKEEASKVPTAIAAIAVELYQPDPTSSEAAEATFSVQVRFSDGSIMVRTGDLVPHITVAQRNALLGFMATLRTQATAEFLP